MDVFTGWYNYSIQTHSWHFMALSTNITGGPHLLAPKKTKKNCGFRRGRQAIFSMLGDVYIVLEGGPNVAAQVTRNMMGNELQEPVNIEIWRCSMIFLFLPISSSEFVWLTISAHQIIPEALIWVLPQTLKIAVPPPAFFSGVNLGLVS